MIDFHSHILPAVDDGSRDVEESLQLLGMLKSQGVNTVVATPHFLSNRESVDEFLMRRQASFDILTSALSCDFPQIILGAEVAYYEGISKLEGLHKLSVGDSRLLLIEMPMCKWSEYSVKEITELACSNRVTIVLAHIERYLAFHNTEAIRTLLGCDVLMQVNASFFNDFFTRHKAFSMLKSGSIHFIGSDCHNITHRPPRIEQAFDLICKKSGPHFLQDFADFQRSIIFSDENG